MFDSQYPIKSGCYGIFPSDMVLRSALIEGMEDLRARPWLLRYCFNFLRLDSVTRKVYGENEINRAVDWFLSKDIPVFLGIRTDDIKMPCIAISLLSSSEAEATLADVHSTPFEDSDIDWPNLAGPFVATSYDPNTGIITLPEDSARNIVLSRGQLIVDRNGLITEILQVNDFTHIVVAKGQTLDLSQTYIRGQKPAYITSLESKIFRETYQITCNVNSEPVHLIYLHSIVVFICMMYKQSLFETRNFERTEISSADLTRNFAFENETVYARAITMNAYVRQMWPKNITPKATAIAFQTRIADSGHLFDDVDAPNQLWIGELDALGSGSLPQDTPPNPNTNQKTGGAPLIYWGVQTNPGTITENFIKGLPYSIASQTKANPKVTFNAGSGQYCWYAFPASYGGSPDDFTDSSSQFPFGGSFVATVNVSDSLGNAQPYTVYRSDYPNLGLVYMEVS